MLRGLGHPSRPASGRNAIRRGGGDDAMTVGELTRRVKSLLEGSVGAVAVTGEISGLKASPSGHVYFSLKDAEALLDCVVWKSAASRLRDLPADGARATVRGKLTVYEPRGRYQLVVSSFVSGQEKGDLWRKFEEVKERLAAEGLFAPERKAPLPGCPATVGIVTSPTGAALRDILKILLRRAPGTRVVLSPCLVQGREAVRDIVRAVSAIDRWGGADVVIVGRGGGSIEDLWAFNEEPVARAIADMKTPVVSAVGHETDFTIADFVADARAATPSEAAERVVPDQGHLRERVARAAVTLSRRMSGTVRDRHERLSGVAGSPAFRRPLELFMPRWQRLDEAMAKLGAGMAERFGRAENRIEVAGARLGGLSPLKVLERGYAVVLSADGRAVLDANALSAGDAVTAVLHKGKIGAVVTAVDAGS